ncbi:hypothetical protein [Streptomyces globisporus]
MVFTDFRLELIRVLGQERRSAGHEGGEKCWKVSGWLGPPGRRPRQSPGTAPSRVDGPGGRAGGLIAKRLTSRYEPGARSKTWVKIKVHRLADVVIGGWVADADG